MDSAIEKKAKKAFLAMHYRCREDKKEVYIYHAGRGIKVCPEWETFERFVRDLGYPPSSEHTLERIDNNKDYSPGNCKWALRQTQGANRRRGNKNGYTGVSYDKRKKSKPWLATIRVNGKKEYIGRYPTKEEAALAYDAMARELYGNEAFTNF